MPSFKPALYGLFQYHISELKNDLSELNDQAVALPAPFQQPLPHPQRPKETGRLYETTLTMDTRQEISEAEERNPISVLDETC